MINRDELKRVLERISKEILDEIVYPVCGILDGVLAKVDPFVVDLSYYSLGNEEDEIEIIKRIHTKYKIPYLDQFDQISFFEEYMTISQMALCAVLFGEVEGVE